MKVLRPPDLPTEQTERGPVESAYLRSSSASAALIWVVGGPQWEKHQQRAN